MPLHSWLLFVMVIIGLSCLSPMPHAAAQAPERGGTYRVVNVASTDRLNLREAPGARAKVLKRIPSETSDLIATGQSRTVGDDTWIQVTYAGTTGWVSAQYVTAPNAPPALKNPVAAPSVRCERDYRNVSFDDNSARVRGYVCQSSSTSLRVEFHRISEVAIGSILMAKPLGTVDRLLGVPSVVRNDVKEELELLFKQFGNRRIRYASDNGMQIGTKIDTPVGGVSYSGSGVEWPPDTPQSSRQGWEIWDITQGEGIIISTDVPIDRQRSGYRPMNAREHTSLNAYLRRVCRNQKEEYACRRYPLMLTYMAGKSEIPSDLRLLGIEPGADGCVPEAVLFTRSVITEAILIENISSTTGEIGALLGQQLPGSKGFRKVRRTPPGTGQSLPMNIVLKPNESVLIFTRLILGRAPELYSGGKRLLQNEHVYGPEISVSGLIINGERFELEERSANYLEVIATPEGMSCPVLYAWDQRGSKWQNLGKVIHTAQGKSREATETIELPAFSSKVRLTEEEVEESFIDQVELVIVFKSGDEHRLAPREFDLAEKDGRYAHIAPFRALDVEFEVPSWINTDDIVRTSVAITGYYQRVPLPLTRVRREQ